MFGSWLCCAGIVLHKPVATLCSRTLAPHTVLPNSQRCPPPAPASDALAHHSSSHCVLRAEASAHVPAGSIPTFIAARRLSRFPAVPTGAQMVLSNWPGSKACNDKTWINDCTSKMTAQVNGSNVVLTPAVSAAFNERCDPVQGLVIGPKGTQAAVSFPQYPIGLTSTGPDGTFQIDFSATAADDPNNMDWSQCIVTYKIIQGSFLNPVGGMYANMANRQANALAAGSATGSAAAGVTTGWLQLLAAMAAAALLLVQL